MNVINGKVYYSFWEKCWNKIRHSKLYNNSITWTYRRKKINNSSFSIISNNCWGGICYEYFGLQKTSPTVGCYFFSKDYIKFITNLKYYLSQELHIIPAEESIHYDSLKRKNELTFPIGKLDDIEIVFLHYTNPEEAVQKWNRRVARINWNNLIIKYSNMNEPTEDDINTFVTSCIPNSKKLLFLNKSLDNVDLKQINGDIVFFPEFKNEESLLDDTLYWKKYFNLFEFINS